MYFCKPKIKENVIFRTIFWTSVVLMELCCIVWWFMTVTGRHRTAADLSVSHSAVISGPRDGNFLWVSLNDPQSHLPPSLPPSFSLGYFLFLSQITLHAPLLSECFLVPLTCVLSLSLSVCLSHWIHLFSPKKYSSFTSPVLQQLWTLIYFF